MRQTRRGRAGPNKLRPAPKLAAFRSPLAGFRCPLGSRCPLGALLAIFLGVSWGVPAQLMSLWVEGCAVRYLHGMAPPANGNPDSAHEPSKRGLARGENKQEQGRRAIKQVTRWRWGGNQAFSCIDCGHVQFHAHSAFYISREHSNS
jgi:hypothetical protein